MKQVQRCTPEEKQHMIDLIIEMKKYVDLLSTIMGLPMNERISYVERMKAIQKEMKEFRKRYPLD